MLPAGNVMGPCWGPVRLPSSWMKGRKRGHLGLIGTWSHMWAGPEREYRSWETQLSVEGFLVLYWVLFFVFRYSSRNCL